MVIFAIAVVATYIAMAGYILYQAYMLDRMHQELKFAQPPF